MPVVDKSFDSLGDVENFMLPTDVPPYFCTINDIFTPFIILAQKIKFLSGNDETVRALVNNIYPAANMPALQNRRKRERNILQPFAVATAVKWDFNANRKLCTKTGLFPAKSGLVRASQNFRPLRSPADKILQDNP